MTTGQTSEVALMLNEQERDALLLVLEQALKEGRIQEHRTEAFHAQAVVHAHVDLLQGLWEKLRRLPD